MEESSMSKITLFADELLSRYATVTDTLSITDEVFLTIQNDRDLMHQYLRLVEESGLDAVNQQLGKRIKKHFGLTNLARCESPKSTLIQSYQQFE